MTDVTIGLLSVLALLIVILSGVHIGFSLLTVSFVGMLLLTGSSDVALNLLGAASYSAIREYVFAVVPMFLLMGAFMTHSRAAKTLFDAAYLLTRRLIGGLAVATVFANAIFAAVTGVSVASATVFTRLSYPHMMARGYSKRLALGVVAGSSILGMLIPPSLLMILYGILTGVSIGSLFIAGVVPGIILAGLFCMVITIIGVRSPQSVGRTLAKAKTPVMVGAGAYEGGAAPGSAVELHEEAESIGRTLLQAAPVLLLIAIVIGGIWGGLFTPTEASAVGALGAFLVGLTMGLNVDGIKISFQQTAMSTGAIMFLLISASLYSRMLASSGLVNEVSQFFSQADVGATALILLFVLLLVILGCFLDSSSIILLTTPVIFPTILALQVDPLWFGLILIVAVEVGILTPPFGMVPFAMNSVLGDEAKTEDIFIGAAPFILMMFVLIALMMLFPFLVTWLPNLVLG